MCVCLTFVTDAPEVSTDSLLPTTIDAWGILVLRCSYVGVPEAYVTWTLNDSVLNSTVDSGINTSTITTGSSMTTTLTWIHVPVIAQGTYYCVLVNAAGSGSGSYTIQIASESKGGAAQLKFNGDLLEPVIFCFNRRSVSVEVELVLKQNIMLLESSPKTSTQAWKVGGPGSSSPPPPQL